MNEPTWLKKEAILHLHGSNLSRFGGSEGLRDEGLLESALYRFNDQEDIDLADLASSYAFGLGRNHPFVDGNKRMALLACGVFLEINRCIFVAGPADAYSAITALAAGEIGEREFAAWIRQNCKIPTDRRRRKTLR